MRPIFLLFLLACGALHADQYVAKPQADEDLTPTAMSMILDAQLEVLAMHFGTAKIMCAEVESMAPDHPIPLMIDVGCRLYEIEENIESGQPKDNKAYAEFYAKVDALIKMAKELERLFPDSPYPKLHLGAAYGCQGLVKLHEHSYLASYRDGKRGVEYLQKAVALDPKQYNGYMGLGQFEYYCARLNGLLQFMLDLQGDEKKGIEKLKVCAEKGSYTLWPARIFLCSILTYDQRDWQGMEPYIDLVIRKFPENYHYVRIVATYALGNGIEKAKSRELLELCCERWDKGWRPPAYVKDFSLEPARLELARYYMKERKNAEARHHLESLVHSEDAGLSKSASSLLSKLN